MRVIELPLSRLDEFCVTRREGFKEAIIAASTISQDGIIRIPSEAWAKLIVEYMKPPQRGLGDAVASVAQPIAKAIDAVLGTNLKGCGGCQQRREALNKLVPRL